MGQEKLKPNVVEAPTIFIGVGGTGSKIVKKVYKLCDVEERANISFVCMDTNVNDLKEIKNDCEDMRCVQTSNTQTVGSYLDNDKDAARNWFPKNAVIYDKTVSEGAGQLRAISRLALNSTIKTGKIAPLFDAIDELFKKNGQAMKQALRICVVSTASGGTGSGMILPFCMFIRDYVNNKYPNASVILRTLLLLPETLDSVITSNIERESQRRNAYATIKEINAFMMKGSGFCDIEESLKRYQDLHIDIPDPGKKGLKTLSVLPCDFCFLLDGQDAEDATSTSFSQYQDQAAYALYEQSVGPMQKKAFSVEDNIIKELSNPGNYGRNRFGGIGAGRIVYPYEKVVRFIANEWTKSNIGGEGEASKWLKFDNEAKLKERQDIDAQRSQDECDPWEKKYIDALDHFAVSDKFSKDLKGTYKLDDADKRNKTFMSALEAAVVKEVANNAKIKGYKNALAKLGGDGVYNSGQEWASAPSDYENLSQYNDAIEKVANRVAASYVESILYNDVKTQKIAGDGAMYLESILKTADNHYCHPNAARYMLYKLQLEAGKKAVTYDNEITKLRETVNSFFSDKADNPFIVKSRKDGKEINSLRELCNAISEQDKDNRRGKKIGGDIAKLLNDEMSGLYNALTKLEGAFAKKAVYSAINEYTQELNKQYKKFFDGFKKNVADLDNRQYDLIEELKYKKGDSVRYVCVSRDMLEELGRSTNMSSGSQMLDDELNAQIFDSIKANARFDRTVKMSADCIEDDMRIDIFDDVLVKYFEKKVFEECNDIDMNIVEAIARECKLREILKKKEELKDGEPLTVKYDEKKILAYIKDVIASGSMISAPGIQKMVGEESREINVCAYNKELKNMRNYRMDDLISNAEAVDSVSKYELHYFNALYNLTPDKLKKFAARKVSDTGTKPAGLYHSAYTEYTRDIGPDCLKSSKMTTHIDRRWDSIAAMPELDLGYQQVEFLRTHRALVYALVFNRIKKMKYLDDNAKLDHAALAFRYVNTDNHVEDMVVSNGTLCDEFYEILDSLYMDRKLVENIYEFEKKEVARDIMKQASYHETTFHKYVQDFKMPYEYVKEETDANGKIKKVKLEAVETSSLFEIPLYYYNTIPSYKHDEAELISIVDAVIKVFQKQIQKYESAKNAKFVLCDELDAQFDLLVKNYKKYEVIHKGVKMADNKILEIIERRIQDVLESSPQPENYEDCVASMREKLGCM